MSRARQALDRELGVEFDLDLDLRDELERAASIPSTLCPDIAPWRRPKNPSDAELEQERERWRAPAARLGAGARRLMPIRYE